jgi:protein-tyrosine phosphatase
MITQATEIVPRLFLGTREDAEALGERVPDDWTCISVTEYRAWYGRKEELPREPIGSLDMPFMIKATDGWHADPYKLDLLAEVIRWRLAEGKRVLVHCVHGQERSPLTVVWYLAACGEAASIEHAYERVKRLHPRTERRDHWLRGATPRSSRSA